MWKTIEDNSEKCTFVFKNFHVLSRLENSAVFNWNMKTICITLITFCILFSGGRYSVFPSGELHIRNVTPSDGSMSYRCQTSHRLTHEIIVSATSGRLIVTGICLFENYCSIIVSKQSMWFREPFFFQFDHTDASNI